jgi:regulator of sigma E protease
MGTALGNSLLSLAGLIVTLGILVTVHEFGHFWVARRLGVKVLRFSVGFGRPLWRRQGADGTEYVVAAVPLGGYVRMLDEREAPVAEEELARAFNRQPVGRRIAIVVAGPLSNFLFAILAYSVVFMLGVSGVRPLLEAPVAGSVAARGGFQAEDLIIAVAGQPVRTVHEVSLALLEHSLDEAIIEVQVEDADDASQVRSLDLQGMRATAEQADLFAVLGLKLWPLPAVAGEVLAGSPAERAGFLTGDRILAVDDQPIRDWSQLVEIVQRHPDQLLTVRIERDGQTRTLQVTPEPVAGAQGRRGRIGLGSQVPEAAADRLRITLQYGPLAALGQGCVKTWETSLLTLRMLGRMLIGRASLENLSGPLTIAQFAGQSVRTGWVPSIIFLALVSVSLGVLNLLPVPVLDGGHLLYYGIEWLKGSPLPERVQELGQRLGIVLLVLLMSLALFNDLARLLG